MMLVLTAWSGAPASKYVPGHNLSHHKYLQSRKDIMRTSKMKHRISLINLITFVPTIIGAIERNDAKYFAAQKAAGRAIY